MVLVIRRISLGLILIALTSGALLISDLGNRKGNLASRGPVKKWKVTLIEFNNAAEVEETEQGVRIGLKESGLVEGRDYEIAMLNAQGDMATVSSLVDAAITNGADMLIALSSPTLQAAVKRSQGRPVVFSYIASPVATGAGKSDTDHAPNITGVYMQTKYEDMMKLLRECLPSVRTVGTLFAPTEVNMVVHKDRLVEAANKAGIEVIALPVNSTGEVSDSALALCSRKIDVVCQIPGNLVASSFAPIASAAKKANLPVFAFSSPQSKTGAAIVLSRDYTDVGRESGLVAARVMRGENPANIPFKPSEKTRLIVNLDTARATGLNVPQSILNRADEVIGK